MGCGDLVLELKMRLAQIPPLATLLLRTTDPGAIEDIPAWCRLTGHRLVRAVHPDYTIQRKEN
jgi:tRNA 2-thiouridine synthesizing protein A